MTSYDQSMVNTKMAVGPLIQRTGGVNCYFVQTLCFSFQEIFISIFADVCGRKLDFG